ncbi:hypothetical protein KBX18_08345 [Corynebacterium sp. CCUG 69979]|uniref:hypothetical protein n=1 Tax=Corynebacterium sp. CCUG 69979 TaxID=2823890 RepID=UPI00210AF773|nr:hypothetical protein [Corynebacterium sp. CCUG 69979]MCQ4625559.1 hypothetical protein [Corynebacterium sp. CCUG 69979]
MDVKEIITHLSNFQDTWKGWDKVISGLTDFFGKTPTEKIKDYFSSENEGFKQLSSVFGN